VGAAVVNGRYLHVLLSGASVDILVLDSYVRKVNLSVEIRQVMIDRPHRNLVGVPVGTAVTVRTAAILRLQEALVLALELVVEYHATQPIAAANQPIGSLVVGAIHLDVVFQLSRFPNARVELLLRSGLDRAALAFQEVASIFSERHDAIPVTGAPHSLDQSALTEMAQVGRSRIINATGAGFQVSRRDDSEGTNRRQDAALVTIDVVVASSNTEWFPTRTNGEIDVADGDVQGITPRPVRCAHAVGRPATAAQLRSPIFMLAMLVVSRIDVTHSAPSVDKSKLSGEGLWSASGRRRGAGVAPGRGDEELTAARLPSAGKQVAQRLY
jgi:hypothetical protein